MLRSLERDPLRSSRCVTRPLVVSWRSAPFLCSPLVLAACGGGRARQRASPRSTTRPIKKADVRPLAERRRAVRRQQTRRRPARADGPGRRRTSPSASRPSRRPRPSRPRASRSRPTRSSRRSASRSTTRCATRSAVPDLRPSGSRARPRTRASRSPTRRSRSQFDEQKKQSFPKDADYQKFLKTSGMTRGGHPPARQARPAVEQDPRQGHQGQGQGHRRPDQRLLQQEQGALRAARAARPAHRPDQDQGQGRRGQGGARRAASRWKSVAKKYSIDEASKAQGGKLPAVPRASRRRRSTTRVFGAKKGKLVGPGQDPVRLLRLRGHEDHAGLAAVARRRPRRRSSRLLAVAEPAEGARRRSSRTSASSGRTRRTAARAT